MTRTVYWWPHGEPVPPGWKALRRCCPTDHHDHYSRLIELVDPEADRAGLNLAEPPAPRAGWPSPEEFWP